MLLDRVKLLLGLKDDSKDDLLTLLIQQAIEESLEYTHGNEVGDTTIIKMVVFNYNRLGTEGLDSEGYSGVDFTYSADYPEAIIRALKAHRKIQTV